MDVMLFHLNAPSPNSVTVSGIVTCCSAHQANAFSFICVMPSCSSTSDDHMLRFHTGLVVPLDPGQHGLPVQGCLEHPCNGKSHQGKIQRKISCLEIHPNQFCACWRTGRSAIPGGCSRILRHTPRRARIDGLCGGFVAVWSRLHITVHVIRDTDRRILYIDLFFQFRITERATCHP